MTLDQAFLHSALNYPHQPALIYSNQIWSYSQIAAAVTSTCHALETHAIGSGQRVGLLLGREPEYVVSYLAIAALGAVAVPFSVTTPPELFAREAAALRLAAVVTSRREPARTAGLPAIAPPAMPLPADGSALESRPPEAVLARFPCGRVGPDAPLVMLATSGTTGEPKRACLTHRAVLANARAHRQSVGERRGERVLVALDLHFGYANTAQLVNQLDAGGTLVLLAGGFTPRSFCATVEAQRVTSATVVPTLLLLLSRYLADHAPRMPSLRTLVYGGSPMPPGLRASLRQQLPHVELVETYGQTEAGPRVTTLREADTEGRPGSVGRPVPGVEVGIVAEGSRSLTAEPGVVGEIWVRSPGVMAGFAGVEEGEPRIVDGWLRTGDLGWLDRDGFLYLHGRADNLIITSGMKVLAEEVEGVIREVAGVRDTMVFGRPDDERGRRVEALVVAEPGARLQHGDIVRQIRRRLLPHKIPSRFFLVDDLPRTDRGKTPRRELPDLAEGVHELI